MVAVPVEHAVSVFARVFADVGFEDGLWIARAPGRVNLIGEHTDYSEGFVLPVAIDCDIVIAFRPRPDSRVRLYSSNYGQRSELSLADIAPDDASPWSNYFRGVAQALSDQGIYRSFGVDSPAGLDGVIVGDIPMESGLSSSAALEVASAFALLAASGVSPRQLEPECADVRREIALACRRAENSFVGVACGVMDQMASIMGRRSHAVFLDCRNLECQLVPVMEHESDVALVVYDTGIRRELVESGYNLRRAELEKGAEMIVDVLNRPDTQALRDVGPADLEAVRDLLPPTMARRCEHVIGENERVLRAVKALREADLVTFGQLMYESHASLRTLFEVSCPELDRAVDVARSVPGVLGARMTGAGFGGCTVNLVKRQAVESLTNELARASGLGPSCLESTSRCTQAFVVEPADGASVAEVAPYMVQALAGGGV